MNSVVLYSGGVCSHLAAKRWVNKYGPCILLFSDTGIEDYDLYRFIEEGAKSLGCELIKVKSEETFEEMIVRHKALPSSRMPFCSKEMKVMPAKRWLKEHPEIKNLIVGLDWTEPHRLEKVKTLWPGYEIHAPMMYKPYLLKVQMLQEVIEDGIKPPRLYELGFAHNNCGGGCVRGGHTAWRHLSIALPEVFEEWVKREELIPGYTFNTDRRNKQTVPITLRQLADLHEDVPKHDWGGCGCFVDDE